MSISERSGGSVDIPFISNSGMFPLVNFNFMLRVEAVTDVPCKSVHSFTKENEYEYIQEGGLNDYVHMKRKPISKPFTFRVERYVGLDYVDPLPNGTELLLPLLLFVSRKVGDFAGDVVRCYTFTGCTVMAKEFGELSAESSGLLTETTTIAFRQLLVVDIPLGDQTYGSLSELADHTMVPAAEPKLWDNTEELERSIREAKKKELLDIGTVNLERHRPPADPRILDIPGRTTGGSTVIPRMFDPKDTQSIQSNHSPRLFDPKDKQSIQSDRPPRIWSAKETT